MQLVAQEFVGVADELMLLRVLVSCSEQVVVVIVAQCCHVDMSPGSNVLCCW